MQEHDIQNRIRVELSARGHKVFRVNVVEGWVGDAQHLRDGSVLLRNPRRVSSGVPRGFPDLMAVMRGGRVAFIECKSETGRPTKDQEQFIAVMREIGCAAGIARSTEDAIKITEG